MATKLSIFMALYNGERWVEEAIASIQAQTLTDWELVVLDNQSTDDGFKIVQSLAKKDHRVKSPSTAKNAEQIKHKAICLDR